MKVLLDECIDARLAREITGHNVRTVPQMGWSGIKDQPLLALAVVVLKSKTNRLADLKPLVSSLLATLPTVALGKATPVSA